MSKASIITDYDQFRKLREEWNNLTSLAAPGKLWLTHEWYTNWWESFGTGQQLFIGVVQQDGQLVGIAPLMLQERKLKGIRQRVLGFIENGLSPRSQLVVSPNTGDVIETLWEELSSRSSDWDLAQLNNFESGEELDGFKSFLGQSKIPYVEEKDRQSPYIDLAPGWDQVQDNFGKWLRRNLRRGERRLGKDAELDFEVLDTPEELPRGLKLCFDISDRSWKGEEGVAMADRKARASFFERLVNDPEIAKAVCVYLLKRDSVYIAFEMMLEYERHALAVAADYDLEQRKNSPGAVLKSFILEHQIENGIKVYDFDGTLYDYKMYWTDQVRPHSKLWVFHGGIKSRVLHLAKKWFKRRADDEDE